MVNIFSPDLKCIMIDWDGTLASAEPMVHEAYVATFKELGDNRPWTLADTHARNGEDPKKIFADKTLWGDKCAQAFDAFYKHYRRLNVERRDLFGLQENATNLLHFLRNARPDVKVVIMAAKTQELLEKEVRETGVDGLVHAVVGNTAEGPNKPDVRVVDRVLAEVGVTITDKATQVWHIADNLDKDVKFSENAGVTYFIVNEKGQIKTLEQLQTMLSTVTTAEPVQQRPDSAHIRQ